jgi:TM2 domain-containing membrane protein YozV
MIALFLLLVIVAMALGIVGVVVKGLFYLLFTGIGVLLIAFFLGALWMRRRTRRRRHAR